MKITDFFSNKAGILGMNMRNANFTRVLNSKKARRTADFKLICKKLLRKSEIPVPKTYARIKTFVDLQTFDWSRLPKSFVLKPNRGTHGQGILITYGKSKKTNDWIGHEGKKITISDLRDHVTNIIEGKYSMGNARDTAFFEERIKGIKVFKPYLYKGLPDVRIIVFNKVPIMAMLRLPTKRSEGKANLHAGCIGVGIDMATGVTTNAVVRRPFGLISDVYDAIETTYEEPHLPLRGIQIPHWNKILRMSVLAQEASELGYVGVDITIDREKGPIILELNARPGLSIQLANLAGLKERLDRVSGIKIASIDRGISLGKTLFGGEIEEEIENVTGKHVVGTTERIKLYGLPFEKKTRKKKKIKSFIRIIKLTAKIDTGATRSSIDEDTIRRLGYGDGIDFFKSIKIPEFFDTYEEAKEESSKLAKRFTSGELQEHPEWRNWSLTKSSNGFTIRPIFNIKMEISGVPVLTTATAIDRSGLEYKAIIGLKDLKNFIIDPSKRYQQIKLSEKT